MDSNARWKDLDRSRSSLGINQKRGGCLGESQATAILLNGHLNSKADAFLWSLNSRADSHWQGT